MATYYYVVLTRAVPGKLADFEAWYDGRHLSDCVRHPAIKSARRLKLLSKVLDGRPGADTSGKEAPWESLAIYEIESDDPDAVARDLSTMAGTEAMPMTDAFFEPGTLTMIAAPAGTAAAG